MADAPVDELLNNRRTPPVLVVLLNWNRARDTIEWLEGRLGSTWPRFSIVVCEKASGARDFEESRSGAQEMQTKGRLKFRLVPREEAEKGAQSMPSEDVLLVQTGENLGFASGNNVALRFAANGNAYEYVWILNNDAIVERHALSHLVYALEQDPALAAAGSNLYSYDEPGQLDSLGGGPFNANFGIDTPFGEDVTADNGLVVVDHVIGTSMLVRASIIRSVGIMDERYFLYREETDWCLRMRDHGWRLACSVRSVVWHKNGGTVGRRTPTHDYYSVRNMLWLIKRYSPQTLFTVELYTFARAMFPKLMRLEFGRMRSVLKAFLDFHRGIVGKADLSGLERADSKAHVLKRAKTSPETRAGS